MVAGFVERLKPAVRQALENRAEQHGRSVEDEIIVILRDAVGWTDDPFNEEGLGTQIARPFREAGVSFEQENLELRG